MKTCIITRIEYAGFYRMTPDSSTNMSVNGWAVRHAARILKQKILESATSPSSPTQRGSFQAAFPNTKPEELDIKDSIIFVKSNPSKRMSIADSSGWPARAVPVPRMNSWARVWAGLSLSSPQATTCNMAPTTRITPGRASAARPISWRSRWTPRRARSS